MATFSSHATTTTMLRAEREWFPHFLQLCKKSKAYSNVPEYQIFLRRVTHTCKSFKEVLEELQDFGYKSDGCNTIGIMFLHKRIYYWKEQAKRMTSMMHKRRRVVRRPSFLPIAASWHDPSSSSKILSS